MKQTLYFALGRILALFTRVRPQDAPQAKRGEPRLGLIGLANEDFDEEDEGRLIGLANAFQAGADDWVQLAPKGDHPHGKYVQRVDSASIQTIISSFKEEAKTAGNSFAGKPFYIGHPDVAHLANQFPDKKAYGWLTDLAEKPDGLYGRVKWSEPGRKLIENAHYKFLSPYWGAEEAREGGKLLAKPVELVSVGLTNHPQIKGGKPLANERIKAMKTKLAALAALLKLANDASEEAIATAVETKITALEGEKTALANDKAAVDGQLATEKAAHQTTRANFANEKQTLAQSFQAERNARIELLLDHAIQDGRVTVGTKAAYQTKLANVETFAAGLKELAALTPTVKTEPKSGALGDRKVALANEQERRASLSSLVYQKQAAGLTYEQAYAAVKRENPELFAAMTKPEAA